PHLPDAGAHGREVRRLEAVEEGEDALARREPGDAPIEVEGLLSHGVTLGTSLLVPEPFPRVASVTLGRAGRASSRVRAEAPGVALGVADAEAAGAVVRILQRPGELGAGPLRPLVDGVRLLGDDIEHRPTDGSREVRVLGAGAGDHHPAALGPEHLAVLDDPVPLDQD